MGTHNSKLPHLDSLHKRNRVVFSMRPGKERRVQLLELLNTGYRILADHPAGGTWNSKDSDLKYLLKKSKIKRFKERSSTIICPNRSLTYYGIY